MAVVEILNPFISVIIPVFNGEHFIADAIQSVLDQHYHPLEIIVVDDGSNDGTALVVKNIEGSINYFYQENAGIAASRNKGIELAQGELITFIDADDVWVENKLNLQCRLMKENPSVEIIFGFLLGTQMINRDRLKKIDVEKEKGLFATQLGSMLIKRIVFDRVGRFDEEMRLAEDLDWVNRVREAGISVLAHEDIVQFYRMHDKNITKDKGRTNSYILKAYKKSLDRRRASGNKSIHPLPKLENIDGVLKYWNSKK